MLLLLLCSNTVWGQAPLAHDGAVLLRDADPGFQLDSRVQTWMAVAGTADITRVAAAPELFSMSDALERHQLKDGKRLWIRLRLQRAPHSEDTWTLNVPLPTLDLVNLYQRDSRGHWSRQSNGDVLAQVDWSRHGLYPEFSLDLPAGVTKEIYLEVQNFKHTSVPIRLAPSHARESQRQLETTNLGLMLGALLTLVLLSTLRYVEHRDRSDALAAFYGLAIALTIAQINGVLNLHLWRYLPEWADWANSILPVITIGLALLFVRQLYELSTRYDRYHAFLKIVGWATIASTLLFAVVDRSVADILCAGFMFAATTVGLAATILAWRGGSPIGLWLVAAYLPQFLGLLRLISESAGLVQTFWQMRYMTSLSVAIAVPILVYSLGRVTHDRKQLRLRADQLATQDALTGLLSRPQFQIQLNAAYHRVMNQREPVALVLVTIRNHQHILDALGPAVGEQCVLRGVVKLQRILRDIDPAGRTGVAQFGLLLEGVSSRQKVSERMVKLIGSGLIPLAGLKPEVTLHFQAACVLLHENPLAPDVVLQALEGLLEKMGTRTRRPIRFLEPQDTQAAELDSDQ
jgi:diguanylate cyclase (GGDEF)-like protein